MFASTNFPENLDAALRRPGRFDVDLRFDFATHEQAMDIYKHFYAPIPHIFEEADDSSPSYMCSDPEKSQVNDEAEHFANVIAEAEIQVSIAMIQAFLLLYKREPEIVQEKVAEWAAGIRTEQSPIIDASMIVDEAIEGDMMVQDDRQKGNQGAKMVRSGLKQTKEKKQLEKVKVEVAQQAVQGQRLVSL